MADLIGLHRNAMDREEGKAFIPRYIELLSAGGSMSSEDSLKQAGVDIRSVDIWQGRFETGLYF